MKNENGVYTTPCTVNGLKLSFIFDTGASNVAISLSEAIFMLKNGYLNKEDLHGSSYSQIANGDIIENTTVTLKELEIGGIKLYNIDAIIIHEISASLLLGQSAINKLGKIQIEGDELVILNADSPSSIKACVEAQRLIIEGEKYLNDGLYTLSADNYQKAYDLCPVTMNCYNTMLLGYSYFSSNNYPLAIKYLEKSANCMSDSQNLMVIYSKLGPAYKETSNYSLATLNIQKALSYAKKYEDKSLYNSILGHIYISQENYSEAIIYLEKSIEDYLKSISATTNDVMRGKVKDKVLGGRYLVISICYNFLNSENKSDEYAIKSALCGDEDAIKSCEKYGLKYEMFKE